MVDIAEENPKVGSEAPERDSDVPSLPSPAMGICAMECIRNKSVQGRRSQNAEAFEAGYNEGYGDGYVDGYDDGQYNQLIGLIREFEEWLELPVLEGEQYRGLQSALQYLRYRLEHDR